jgi:hypothetical protein
MSQLIVASGLLRFVARRLASLGCRTKSANRLPLLVPLADYFLLVQLRQEITRTPEANLVPKCYLGIFTYPSKKL